MHHEIQGPRPQVHERRRIPIGLGIILIGIPPDGHDSAAHQRLECSSSLHRVRLDRGGSSRCKCRCSCSGCSCVGRCSGCNTCSESDARSGVDGRGCSQRRCGRCSDWDVGVGSASGEQGAAQLITARGPPSSAWRARGPGGARGWSRWLRRAAHQCARRSRAAQRQAAAVLPAGRRCASGAAHSAPRALQLGQSAGQRPSAAAHRSTHQTAAARL
mmetsp:Transcript_81072/g.242939  ORF Transcript_81072/g.242939 Transcript_81072/m.242939 type:complete len:216 (+) Transcript_81072:246-893(+)